MKQEFISSMLTVDAAATCHSQAPILYHQIKKKEKKKDVEQLEKVERITRINVELEILPQITKEETNVFSLSKRKRMQNTDFKY